MQLGTRWAIGDTVPERLPQAVRDAVRSVEEELATTDATTGDWRWTLTFLEGRAVVDLDDGTRVKQLPDGAAVVTSVELDSDRDSD